MERVILNIRKKYKILGNSQPIDYLNKDDAITVFDIIVTASTFFPIQLYTLINMTSFNFVILMLNLNF